MAERSQSWIVLVSALVAATPASPVAAFSDPLSYTDPVELGGGGGRWFTGTPADGYGCDVCHEGGEPAPLTVTGLPLDGYAPGATYEVTMTWPLGVEHVALIAEITDEAKHAAGTLELPPYPAMTQAERCNAEQGGVPAASITESEDGRSFVSVVDCGAQLLRFRWHAPQSDVGKVWLGAGLVTSDENADNFGDGVTMVRHALSTHGGVGATPLVKGCAVVNAPGASGREPGAIAFVCWVVLGGLWGIERGRR